MSQAQEPGWEGRKNEWLAAESGFSSYLCRGNLHRCAPKIRLFLSAVEKKRIMGRNGPI